MPDKQVPIEVGIEKAKHELLVSIEAIASKYEFPASVTLLLMDQIITELKNASLSNILVNINIPLPNNNSDTAADNSDE